MKIEDNFVPYELALKLKEKGFEDECFKKYIAGCLWSNPSVPETYKFIHSNSSDCLAPLYQQVVDWFREKHNIHIHISLNQFGYGWMFALISTTHYKSVKDLVGGVKFKWTYYETLNKAIEESLKLI